MHGKRTNMVMLVVGAAVLISTGSSAAADGGIGSKGTLFVSAERLFGFSRESRTTDGDVAGATSKTTKVATTFSLFRTDPTSSLTLPRLGIDYTVVDGLTIGGAAGFATHGVSSKVETGGVSTESDDLAGNVFTLAPRIGYLAGLTESVGLWLRAGPAFMRFSQTTPARGTTPQTTVNETLWLLSIEPQVIAMLGKNFGVALNLNLDVSLSGSVDVKQGSTTASRDSKTNYLLLGATFGALGRF